MRFQGLFICLVVSYWLIPASAVAETVMPRSVMGNGGASMSSPSYVSDCTVGQTMFGVVEGPANINEIGFWYQYRAIVTSVHGEFEEAEDGLPRRFRFGQNYPNPFNPLTTVEFDVPRSSHVEIKLYDVRGRVVRTLVDQELAPGRYTEVLDAVGLPSGVYFCRMSAENFTFSRKLMLLK